MDIIFFLPRKPILTPGQVERLSNILDNAGQVIFGFVVVSPLVGGFDKIGVSGVVLGAITVIFCWLGSINLAGKKDK